MSHQFRVHYTREQARALLPQVALWLADMRRLRTELGERDQRLATLLADGSDLGGPLVQRWVAALAAVRTVLREFERRAIQIKDLDRGLVDFPSLRQEREVFLCWEEGEDDIEFWHELDAGYAGRERL